MSVSVREHTSLFLGVGTGRNSQDGSTLTALGECQAVSGIIFPFCVCAGRVSLLHAPCSHHAPVLCSVLFLIPAGFLAETSP